VVLFNSTKETTMKTYLEWEAENIFDDYIREVWGDTTKVCGMEYDTADLFSGTDPIRYRGDFLNWLDSMDAQEGTDQYNNTTWSF
jgi:hypothetical protein